MRFKAEVGESNAALFREVKLDWGHLMAMASQGNWRSLAARLIHRKFWFLSGCSSTSNFRVI